MDRNWFLLPLLAIIGQLQQPINTSTTIQFGESIEFRASVFPGDRVTSAHVSVVNAATGENWQISAALVPGRTATMRATLDLSDHKLAPFSLIDFVWTYARDDGSISHSVPTQLEYADDRYEWSSNQQNDWHIYWTAGSEAAPDPSIMAEMETAASDFSLNLPDHIRIFIYPTRESLSFAIGEELLLGHAKPAQGLIYVAGDIPSFPRIIRHELMHLAIFAQVGDGYAQVPAWLNEGIAALAEGTNLEVSSELMPLQNLCNRLPFRSPASEQAYAQSAAVVAFLTERYGKETIPALLDAYAQLEAACDTGLENVLRLSLDQLENDWRESGREPESAPPSVAPWLLLTLPVVVAIATSLGIRLRAKSRS